jgi:Flp pilus assembly protein CpaB
VNQTVVIVALSAVAVVSALLSFLAWYLLARPPQGSPPGGSAQPEDDVAVAADETASDETT